MNKKNKEDRQRERERSENGKLSEGVITLTALLQVNYLYCDKTKLEDDDEIKPIHSETIIR